MERVISIDGVEIGPGHPTYVIAEMSANHGQRLDRAVETIKAAKRAGANAIKLQTYTADTLTIDSTKAPFLIKGGLWDGRTLYDLYKEAYTPWEWHPELKRIADSLQLTLFSSPFDSTAVDFLEQLNVPAYKIASFEIVDVALLKKVAQTGKPIILSTGMATLAEIEEAVATLRSNGAKQIALLRCTSAYPATPDEMNLRTVAHMADAFEVPVGLSDHTLGTTVPVAAVALGACIVEKHFVLSRQVPGPDTAFSLEPAEFASMVDAIRITEKALGSIRYGISSREAENRIFRRSLFVVQGIECGEAFTLQNVRSIRPAHGLHTRYLPQILGRRAARRLEKGTPLTWDVIANEDVAAAESAGD